MVVAATAPANTSCCRLRSPYRSYFKDSFVPQADASQPDLKAFFERHRVIVGPLAEAIEKHIATLPEASEQDGLFGALALLTVAARIIVKHNGPSEERVAKAAHYSVQYFASTMKRVFDVEKLKSG